MCTAVQLDQRSDDWQRGFKLDHVRLADAIGDVKVQDVDRTGCRSVRLCDGGSQRSVAVFVDRNSVSEIRVWFVANRVDRIGIVGISGDRDDHIDIHAVALVVTDCDNESLRHAFTSAQKLNVVCVDVVSPSHFAGWNWRRHQGSHFAKLSRVRAGIESRCYGVRVTCVGIRKIDRPRYDSCTKFGNRSRFTGAG